MSEDKFKNKYRIPSARAGWHDYNGGIYFITICTKNREHYFGKIIAEQQIQLSKIGQYTDEQIRNVQMHYPYAEIPLWVVMPNHLHLITVIDWEKMPYERRNTTEWIASVETRRATSLRYACETANMQGWLSVVIGGIKSSVTKFANAQNIPFAWQPRFNDRIVRDTDELNRIAEYIKTNPAHWAADEFYTAE